MKIVASCSYCGHLFRIEDIFEGVDLPCPKCGETIVIKAMAGVDESGLPVFEPELDTILDKVFSGEATEDDIAKLRAIGVSMQEKRTGETSRVIKKETEVRPKTEPSVTAPEPTPAEKKPSSRRGFRVRLDDSKVIRPPTDMIKRAERTEATTRRRPPSRPAAPPPQKVERPVVPEAPEERKPLKERLKIPKLRIRFVNRKQAMMAGAALIALILIIVIWSLISAAAERRRLRDEAFSVLFEASKNRDYALLVEKGEEFLKKYPDDEKVVEVKRLIMRAKKEVDAQQKFASIKRAADEATDLKTLEKAKDDLEDFLIRYRGTGVETAAEELLKEVTERVNRERDRVKFAKIKRLVDEGKYIEAEIRLRGFTPSTSEFQKKKDELRRFLKEYDSAALALLQQGKTADAQERFDDAIKTLETLVRKYPFSRYSEEAKMLIPVIRDKRKRFRKRRFEELLAYGKRKLQAKEWAEAKRAFEEASKFKPGDPDLIGLLAIAKEKERKYRNMVFIPKGWFIMGSDDGAPDEAPKHKVYLKAYYIAKTPVTNREYKEFIDATGHPVPFVDAKWAEPYNWDRERRTYPEGKADHPVVLVSFEDALAYCKWAGKRLPTEAEWEKAMRGTNGRKYPWGDAPPTEGLANFGRKFKRTTKVGAFPAGASPFGILDGAGNVWEWVQDYYQKDFYRASEHRMNPVCRRRSAERVKRGGSWVDDADDLRCANRSSSPPSEKISIIGFRVAMDAEE